MADTGDWPSREEILGGMPARRAWTLLFLIESHAARRAALVREAGSELASERQLREQELDDLEAFALGREPAHRPTIQELEQTADHWAPLVPDNARLRAAVAALLGRRYRFSKTSVPRLNAALGLDDEATKTAFRQSQGAELETIYTSRLNARERLRFALATPATWLETAPPRRATAALVFGLGVGQPLLAIPIELAVLGPTIGLIVVAALGLVSILSSAAMAEAVVRSAEVRHRGAFFARMVSALLGNRAGTAPVSLAVMRSVLSMLAAFVGLATTMSAETPVPTWIWALLALALVLWSTVISTRSASLGTFTAVGIGSTVILLVLAVACVIHAASAGSLSLSSLNATGTDTGAAGYAAVIGVALMTFVNPVYTVQFARVVLPRDEEGTRFVQGTILGATICVAVALLFGALMCLGLPTSVLAHERSTVLVPINNALGPVAGVATVVVLVGLVGLTLNRNGAALADITLDLLPRARTKITLPRRHAEAVLSTREAASRDTGVSYLGLENGVPRVRVTPASDPSRHQDVALQGPWSSQDPPLRLVVLEATDDHIRLSVETSLRVSVRRAWDSRGASSLDAVLDHGGDAALLAWLVRRGTATVPDFLERIGGDPADAQRSLDRLKADGRLRIVERDGQRVVQAELGARRGRELPEGVWEKLTGEAEASGPKSGAPEREAAPRWKAALLSPVGREIISVLPIVATFAVAFGLLLANAISFAQPLEIAGVISGLTVAGMLPVLLLLAARRRAEVVPGRMPRIIGHPALQIFGGLVAFAVLFAHGSTLWHDEAEKILALLAAAGVVLVAAMAARDGAFRPRASLELWRDGVDLGYTLLGAEGVELSGSQTEGTPDQLLSTELSLAGTATGPLVVTGAGTRPELRVWTREQPAQTGTPKPLELLVSGPDGEWRAELRLGGGQATFASGPGPWRVEVSHTVEDSAPASPQRRRRNIPAF